MSPHAVSVVIPTYNRARIVVRSVRSAILSCRDPDEIIVVDDGSSDETSAVLQPFRERIHYVRLPRGGAGRARNHGIRIARHPLIAFLDSDYEWVPGDLEAKRRLMDTRPEIAFCCSDFAARSQDGGIVHNSLSYWHESPPLWKEVLGEGMDLSSLIQLPPEIQDSLVHIGNLYAFEMAANYVFTTTWVVRKSAVGDALRFAEDLPTYEDWECYGRLAQRGLCAYLASVTAWQHGHSGLRLTGTAVVDAVFARMAVLERVWGTDPAYLAAHAREYCAVFIRQQHLLIRALLRQGRLREAREVLSRTQAAPLFWKVLAHLPTTLVQNGIRARTVLHRARQTT